MPSLQFWKISSPQKASQNNCSEQLQPSVADELFSTKGDYGIETLFEPDEPESAVVDIVFIHGLTGNRDSTWTYNKELFWPKTLLPADLQTSRIITYGYDADVVGLLKTAGSGTLRDHGNSLATDLAMRRKRTNSQNRPLIFVSHSLGGLVVEQALLISNASYEDHIQAIVNSTYGIAFMGTPHFGSNKAKWAGPVTQLSNVLRQTNKEIVRLLRPGSEKLSDVQQEFHTMLESRRRERNRLIELYCFYEDTAVIGVGEIVPKHSAILPGYPNVSIHGTHMSMTKFTAENDAGYVKVRDQLWLWVSNIKKDEGRLSATTGPDQRAVLHYGPVDSRGGTVIQGSQDAGRDITMIFGKN